MRGHGYGYYPTLGEDTGGYMVRPGDCLWLIALRVYGDPTLWPMLYAANADHIGNPNLIYPGQVLRIP